MKKLVSLLLALIMMASCSFALADTSDIFNPMLLGFVEENGAYWNTDDIMRATFAASILTDLALAGKQDEAEALIDGAIAQNASFFSYDAEEDRITVIACGESQTLSIIYSPEGNICSAQFLETTVPPSGAQMYIDTLTENTGDTFYLIDGLSVYQYFAEIMSILTGE